MTLVDHALATVLIVDETGSKFLLVQEGKPGREGLYNLPGGHVEVHETVPEAAIREVKEETGYDVELTGLVGYYQSIYTDMNFSGPVFCAKVVGGEATPSDEHPETRWVSRQELHDMARDGKLFTTFPPTAADHYATRGALPLDTFTSKDHR